MDFLCLVVNSNSCSWWRIVRMAIVWHDLDTFSRGVNIYDLAVAFTIMIFDPVIGRYESYLKDYTSAQMVITFTWFYLSELWPVNSCPLLLWANRKQKDITFWSLKQVLLNRLLLFFVFCFFWGEGGGAGVLVSNTGSAFCDVLNVKYFRQCLKLLANKTICASDQLYTDSV